MSAVGFGDELVRDYLTFRGFLATLKVFESEVKADKDRGFRPDKVVDYLHNCITNFDLNGLRDSWTHLEQRFFVRLEQSFTPTMKKLEVALYRMYLTTCVSCDRHDKILEFFEKMSSELHGQSEWKDWFGLPYLRNVEENPMFATYFSKQWQDTMLLSLHNFLSVVFQSAAMPVILSYEEDLLKHQQLTEENELLKKQLKAALAGESIDFNLPSKDSSSRGNSPELMDDFYVIAPELHDFAGLSSKSSYSSSASSSPILIRRTSEAHKMDDPSDASKPSKMKPRSPSVPPRASSEETFHAHKEYKGPPQNVAREEKPVPEQKPMQPLPKPEQSMPKPIQPLSEPVEPLSKSYTTFTDLSHSLEENKSGFIILSCEKYSEHHSLITNCKFNCTGTSIASSDKTGVIKIWNVVPSISTLSTIMSKTSVISLDWDRKRERLLFYGGTSGMVRLYDTNERRVIKEIVTDGTSSNIQRIPCISCNPTGANFVTSTQIDTGGVVSLWDMKTLTLEKHLMTTDGLHGCSCSFNHNGQLLLVGSSDGNSSIIDIRSSENIASWTSHTNSIVTTEFSVDETMCYTMGVDGKFYSWSVHKTGEKISELPVHAENMYDTCEELKTCDSFGKRFAFNSDGNNVLTCGPLGGVIYKVSSSDTQLVLDIGGHNKPVNTIDWSTAIESSTCICGTVDGKVIVSPLLNQ